MTAIYSISILTILSSLLVIFFEVTTFSSWLTLFASAIITIILNKILIRNPERSDEGATDRIHGFYRFATLRSRMTTTINNLPKHILHYIFYSFLVVGIIFFYSHYQTISSSPLVWTILPTWFLPALLGFIFLWVLIVIARTPHCAGDEAISDSAQRNGVASQSLAMTKLSRFVFPFSFFLFPLIFLLLPILFPIGTDYDPFVHRAAEQTIVSEGHIQPRTILYSGEYGLVSILSTVTSISVKHINIFLLPLLIMLIVPWLLKKTFTPPLSPPCQGGVKGGLVVIAFFLLPFSILTTTVPQSLGIFFLILLLVLFWQEKGGARRFPHEDCLRQVSPASDQMVAEAEQAKLVAFGEPSFRVGNWPRYTFIRYFLFALASFLCHPFPGIAAFIFLGWNIVYSITRTTLAKLQNDEYVALGRFIVRAMLILLAIIVFIGASLAIPGALILNNNLDSQFAITSIHLNPEALTTLKSIIAPSWIRYTDPLSFVHFFGTNYYLLFFIVIVFGIIQKSKIKCHCERVGASVAIFSFLHSRLSRQTHNSSQPPLTLRGGETEEDCFAKPHNDKTYLFSFFSIFASALIVLFYLHPNVTSAEHIQLFTRLFSISLVFLWPLFLDSVLRISNYVLRINYQITQLPITLYSLLFTILIVSNIYLQFPHSDRFVNFKGYLTSQADITTVNAIETNATKPYLVLANQSVGAAALDQFNFSYYVKLQASSFKLQDQYFYSIPISSQAHRYFLRMTKDPSQKLIDEIFQTYEINELYLVLNDYWKISPQSKTMLSQLASGVEIGSDTIFKFRK